MNTKDIYDGINDILSSKFNIDLGQIKPDANLQDDLGLDSVDIMDSICLFEEKFKIKIVDGSLNQENFPHTVKDMHDLVHRKMTLA